jgi:hypothetical protein
VRSARAGIYGPHFRSRHVGGRSKPAPLQEKTDGDDENFKFQMALLKSPAAFEFFLAGALARENVGHCPRRNETRHSLRSIGRLNVHDANKAISDLKFQIAETAETKALLH